MEPEVVKSEIVLPPVLPFKRVQMSDKYPKGQSRGRHWKHLKQILQSENYLSYPANEPNYLNIESPPSMYPSKKFCDITGFEAPYVDPRMKLRYANPEVFKRIRMLPEEYVQRGAIDTFEYQILACKQPKETLALDDFCSLPQEGHWFDGDIFHNVPLEVCHLPESP